MQKNKTKEITDKIEKLEDGAIFISNDFLDIGEYETIRKTLNRLADKGEIQKVMRGIYYRPRYIEILQEYETPSPHHTAMAIARKFNWNIVPSGSSALNLLGLSTQVPAKWTYVSDGPYNNYEMGNVTIEFKHRNNREIAGMSYKTAIIIQAIKELGKDNINKKVINKIQSTLTKSEKQDLLKESQYTIAWVYVVIKKISGQ